jgi:hypothetical protein
MANEPKVLRTYSPATSEVAASPYPDRQGDADEGGEISSGYYVPQQRVKR